MLVLTDTLELPGVVPYPEEGKLATDHRLPSAFFTLANANWKKLSRHCQNIPDLAICCDFWLLFMHNFDSASKTYQIWWLVATFGYYSCTILTVLPKNTRFGDCLRVLATFHAKFWKRYQKKQIWREFWLLLTRSC